MTTYSSDPRRHTAETAQSMADVRYEIDRIDRLLVEIIAERQSFMDAAARIKGSRSAVHDRAHRGCGLQGEGRMPEAWPLACHCRAGLAHDDRPLHRV